MKKLFRNIHLWLSLPFGIVISVICLSGATLVFESEITQALQRTLYRVNPPVGKAVQSPSELVSQICNQVPDTLHLTSLQLSGDPKGTAFASFRETGRKQLSVNPYTGEVLGWTESYPFFQTMRKLHRWLMNPPTSRGEKSVGKVIVGITTLVLVPILISGLVVWVPRTRKALKDRLRVSCSKGWFRFLHDSHVVIGFYCTVFLLVMALTGLTWSFGWYRTAVYSLFGGAESPATQTSAHATRQDGGHERGRRAAFDYSVWDKVVSNLRESYPVYKSLTLGERNVQIAPDPHSTMRKVDTVMFDSNTGDIKDIRLYADASRSHILRGWFYAFHIGSWGGVVTKILYFIAAFSGAILPWSGYYLWWKRTHRKARR